MTRVPRSLWLLLVSIPFVVECAGPLFPRNAESPPAELVPIVHVPPTRVAEHTLEVERKSEVVVRGFTLYPSVGKDVLDSRAASMFDI